MSELNARLRQVLDCVRCSVGERGYPPTLDEIGTAVGTGKVMAGNYLSDLERAGYVTRHGSGNRAVTLTGPEDLRRMAMVRRVLSLAGDELAAAEAALGINA